MKKVIRVSQISVPLAHTKEQILKKACALSQIQAKKVLDMQIIKAVCGCQKERCPVLYIYGSSGSGRASEGEEESGACAGSTSGEVPDSGKTGECFGH